MELKEYQEQTIRTWKRKDSFFDVAHMLFGMTGEFKEIYEATDNINRAEELTDVLWYISNYCNVYGIDLGNEFEFKRNLFYYQLKYEDYLESFQCEISKLTDIEKKFCVYNKPTELHVIFQQVVKVAEKLNDCYAYYEIDPYVAMQNNIDKLRVRYPEKFTEDLALNRDLEMERKTLENNN